MRKTKNTNKKTSPRSSMLRGSFQCVSDHPEKPQSNQLKSAYLVLCDGIDSVNSLAKLYEEATKKRGRGAPTHEEQDLLRAMVAMAGATLDATIKRIIMECLHDVVDKNESAQEEVTKHIERNVLNREASRGNKRLAKALLDPRPPQKIISFIIKDITGESLQSVKQLAKASKILGLDSRKNTKRFDLGKLEKAFEARNQIIHEMDATPGKEGNKRRRQRKKKEMREYAQNLLGAAKSLLIQVDEVLKQDDID